MDLQVTFYRTGLRSQGRPGPPPESLVAEGEIEFNDAGPLTGLKLVGFNVWQRDGDEHYVTFPCRAFHAGKERRFFDYLRTVHRSDVDTLDRVKQWLVDEFKAWSVQNVSGPEPPRAQRRPPSDR